jgi:hypothetical protein
MAEQIPVVRLCATHAATSERARELARPQGSPGTTV